MVNLKDSLQTDEIFFSIVFHLNRMNLSNSMSSDSTEMIFDNFRFLSMWWKFFFGALAIAVIVAIGNVNAKIQNISFAKSVLLL